MLFLEMPFLLSLFLIGFLFFTVVVFFLNHIKDTPEVLFWRFETLFDRPETFFEQFETLFDRPETFFEQFETLFDRPRAFFERFETLFDRPETFFERFETLFDRPRAFFERFETLFDRPETKGSAPGRIRTSDPLIRSQVLYPAKLRAQQQRNHIIFCPS